MGIKVQRSGGIQKVAAEAGEMGKPHAVIGITDPEVATYATYNEYGWVQRTTKKQAGYFLNHFGMMLKPGTPLRSPPRPFMRATFADEVGHWQKILAEGLKHHGLKNARSALEVMARQAQVDIQETIKNNGSRTQKFPDRSLFTMMLYDIKDDKTPRGKLRDRSADSGSGREKSLVKIGTMLHSVGYEIREGK